MYLENTDDDDKHYTYIDSATFGSSVFRKELNKETLPNTIHVILCLYCVDTTCVLPFVKYVVLNDALPSFRLEMPELAKEDQTVYFKNECFRRVLHFLGNIHAKPLDWNSMYRGILKSRETHDTYCFFCDVSSCEFAEKTTFCIIDEIIHTDIKYATPLFKQYPQLKYIFCEEEPIVMPRSVQLYYESRCQNNNTGCRYSHPIYGDFFYFSSCSSSSLKQGQTKYALFDLRDDDDDEDMKPLFKEMFVFEEKGQSVWCVKNPSWFQQI